MKNNPDDRNDNVERIQENIDDTIRNIRLADDMIDGVSDEETQNELEQKNKRRKTALEGMRREIKQEAKYRDSKEK